MIPRVLIADETKRSRLVSFEVNAWNICAAGSKKDTNTDSLGICAQQPLHFLFHVRRLDVLEGERNRSGYFSTPHKHTHNTKVAAGSMPESTLAIKNRRGQINIAQLGTFSKIYSKHKAEASNSSSSDFYFDQSKSEIASSFFFFACLWGKPRWKALFIC